MAINAFVQEKSRAEYPSDEICKRGVEYHMGGAEE